MEKVKTRLKAFKEHEGCESALITMKEWEHKLRLRE